MLQHANNELSHIGARNVRPMRTAADQAEALARNYQDLKKIGIHLHPDHVAEMAKAMQAQDAALTAPLTTASVTTPVQFLQHWLPGFTEIITAARKIDTLIGVTTQGSWEDEEIVQSVLEKTGEAESYGDFTGVPYANWNVNYERRTVVRFEDGMQIGRLEEQRAAAIRVSSADAKRRSASENLEIQRNRVGFFGFNDGDNRTYGFLNDPDLPAYTNLPDGAAGASTFETKTFLEIVADLRSAAQTLRTQSQERIDPSSDMITLAIATSARDYLTTVSDFGYSVNDWIKENYPNWRVESAPELNSANGNANVFYLYAEGVADSGSDDQRSMIQIVPTKFMTVGVDQRSKSYEEAYSNATAGVMTKRPYAFVRRSGC